MSIEVDNLITRNIEQLRDPIKIELLIKKINDFENDKHLVKEKYISLINDYQVKTELEADQRRYFSDETLDSYMERRIQFNLERFYHNYIFFAVTYIEVCKDIELLHTIEKYFFSIIYESIEEKLGYNWNFVLDSTIRFERTVKYEIDSYKEIFKKLDIYSEQKRIIEILEKVRDYNTNGYHNKDIFKNSLLEEFLEGRLKILEAKSRITDECNKYDKKIEQTHILNLININSIEENNYVINSPIINNDDSCTTVNNKTSRSKSKKEYTKSFTIKNPNDNIVKLPGIWSQLVNNEIIDRIDSKCFIRVFSGKPIVRPINFMQLVDLACFISLLRFRYKILVIGNVNQQVKHCFTVAGEPLIIDSFQAAGTTIKKIINGDTSENAPSNFHLIDKILNSAKFHCSD